MGPRTVSMEQLRRQNPNLSLTPQESRERYERELSFLGTEDGGPMGSYTSGMSSFRSAGLIGYGDAAQERARVLQREQEELERARITSEGQRLESQMRLAPQMEAIRGGIMQRMAGNLGVNLPSQSQPYSSGSGYTPSWMQSYQSPQFPSNPPYYR
jgi:hypothetical protein